jgi:hypothetical protein
MLHTWAPRAKTPSSAAARLLHTQKLFTPPPGEVVPFLMLQAARLPPTSGARETPSSRASTVL